MGNPIKIARISDEAEDDARELALEQMGNQARSQQFRCL
jgi:hypothetical protein